jgi:ABC-2 type transport system ATP-binding protein
MLEPIVTVNNLTKRFAQSDSPALDNVSLKIYPGKMTGFVGPDGAGKTTLIRILVGLLRFESGVVTVNGFDVQREAEKIHEMIGYMPQKFGLYEDLSVIENLNLYAELRNIDKSKRKEKFDKLLQITDLSGFQSRLAGKLSGGMKQKLGLACALLGEPKLLLLDEPSVGVDPVSRRELWKMVRNLLSENMTVVWSTAYLNEAEQCDDVVLINDGKMLFNGPPSSLLKNVRGRTWQIRGVNAAEKRTLLMEELKTDGIVDGIIQGKYIRIVVAENTEKPVLPKGEWHKVDPCFEDAFIDILGGGPGGYSEFAAQLQKKPHSEKPVIEAVKLTKKFGHFTAVHENSFQVKRGQIFGLLGPNGAGKSTTFKMMCGLLQPTSGQALVMGLDLKKAASQARSRIGYMAQKFSLYGNLSVIQNLSFFSGLYGLSGSYQKHQIDLMIKMFDLKKYLNTNAESLPLGFKQRLALSCSVMHQPDILFLDEPTSGVDPVTRREFWTHMNGLVEKGVTIMVTTHFMDEAEYCDRISLIYRGENIATGTPDELKDKAREISPDIDSPTLEDAFITLVQQSNN